MKNAATKLFRKLRGVAMVLAVSAGITAMPVLAASNGIYLATATPHYRHPVTGTVEDSGGDGSAVLGQSMTESATGRQALVEVDEDGTTYITVRLKLMDNISDPQFQVDGHAVNAELMQEDYTYNTADYRMPAASENSIIRCTMYVVPMGRNVIFYITVSDLQAGAGDFITSVTVREPAPEQPTEPQQPAAEEPSYQPEVPAAEPSAETTAETTAATTAAPESIAETTAVTDGKSGSSESDEVIGLVEFDEAGNRVDATAVAAVEPSGSSAAAWIALGIAAAAAGGFAVWYFCFFKRKR